MSYYVYFMSNKNNTTLYLGMTNNLERRVWEHKTGFNVDCFTRRYNCVKLVYAEQTNDVKQAIAREKQLKNWKRAWKDELIDGENPGRDDLAEGWGIAGRSPQ